MAEENSLYSHFRPFLKRFILAMFFMAMVAVFTGLFRRDHPADHR